MTALNDSAPSPRSSPGAMLTRAWRAKLSPTLQEVEARPIRVKLKALPSRDNGSV